ncbi:Transcription factor [Stygiomarasmius scandens]|uniref:Transcription factor n=1 Tax=Marasmiellus scandens TaxID=2682957 RepID=A0ABR1J7Z4_9AGAR
MSSAVTGTGSGSTSGNGSDGITATVAVVDEPGGKKKKTTKRRKVNHACLYCRRSHMTCDEGRPCQRWTSLSRRTTTQIRQGSEPNTDASPDKISIDTSNLATIAPATSPSAPASTTLPYLMQPAQTQPSFYYGAEFGSEFSVLRCVHSLLWFIFHEADYPLSFYPFCLLLPPCCIHARIRSIICSFSRAPAYPAILVHHSITHIVTSTHARISPHYTLRISSRRLPRTPPAIFSKPSTTRPSFPHLLSQQPTVSPSLMFASYPGLGSSTPATTAPLLGTTTSAGASSTSGTSATTTATAGAGTTATITHTHTPSSSDPDPSTPSSTQEYLPPPLPAPTKTEKSLLTAADQDPGLSRDGRLSRVIWSKYEAGLLKPYNYVKGYARLSRHGWCLTSV